MDKAKLSTKQEEGNNPPYPHIEPFYKKKYSQNVNNYKNPISTHKLGKKNVKKQDSNTSFLGDGLGSPKGNSMLLKYSKNKWIVDNTGKEKLLDHYPKKKSKGCSIF